MFYGQTKRVYITSILYVTLKWWGPAICSSLSLIEHVIDCSLNVWIHFIHPRIALTVVSAAETSFNEKIDKNSLMRRKQLTFPVPHDGHPCIVFRNVVCMRLSCLWQNVTFKWRHKYIHRLSMAPVCIYGFSLTSLQPNLVSSTPAEHAPVSTSIASICAPTIAASPNELLSEPQIVIQAPEIPEQSTVSR